MRANLAFTNNLEGCALAGELSAGSWLLPSASVAVEEYDQMHFPWHTEKRRTVPHVPRISVRAPGVPPDWLMSIVHRLVGLSQLGDDWDSYGAKPIQLAAFQSAIELVGQTMSDDSPVPSIVPTPDGGVQFEWHTANLDLEVEIGPDGNLSVFFEDGQGEHDRIDVALGHTPKENATPIPECLNIIKQRLPA